jgi:hypothetical protein
MTVASETITDFSTADRLRLVRQAYERFLALAALDCIMDDNTPTLPPSGGREGADRTGAPIAAELYKTLFRQGILDD